MPTKNSHPKQQDSHTDWKTLVTGFVGSMLERIGDNISVEIHKKIYKFKKRSAGTLLIIVGAIFFLVAIAIIINALTFPWLGYLVVGTVAVAIGYVMTKE